MRLAIVHLEPMRTTRTDGDGSIHPGHLPHRRVWCKIGGIETVGHEVSVVGRVTELSTVGIAP